MTKTQHDRLLVRVLIASLGISACVPFFERAEDDDRDDEGNGGTSNGGTSGGPSAACFDCADERCSNEASACDEADGCRAMARCLLACEPADSTCLLDCVPQTADGTRAYAAAAPYYACALGACDECSGSSGGNGGTSGSGGSGAGGGGDSGNGGTESVGGDTGTGGATGGSSGGGGTFPIGGTAGLGGSGGNTGGSTTGGSGGTPTGIQWLSLDGSWADPSAEPNGALQISGAMYAFGDACAQVSYDEATRCVSGMLCDPGPTFANWGAAIGFDFNTTGAEGSPPNVKMPWNASNVGAIGIAWQVSGSAPGLQVWITNMDPIWNGVCAADDCAINGPPDGKASTILGSQDILNFTGMVKDNWGGSGTPYTFNRANVLAIQFKLAAVVSGPTPFSFCIDRLGIVL